MRAALVVLLVTSLALTGCLRDFEETRPENHLQIRDITVSAPVVKTGSLVLAVEVSLDNRAAQSPPLHLVVKAFDLSTGFLIQERRTENLTLEADKTVPVRVDLDLPRKNGYRIEVEAFEDGQVVETGRLEVRNVEALETTTHETGVTVSGIDFLVRNITGNQVRIESQVYLTNEGRETSRTLRAQVKARDLATGLLADQAWRSVPGVPTEETHILPVTLEVPDRHNYEVHVVLWDGNLTVEQSKGTVQLLPTLTKQEGEEIVVSDPRIEDFVRAGGPGGDRSEQGFDHAAESAETPGPGALVALGAVALTALVAGTRRWT